jgi:hypothetical protein
MKKILAITLTVATLFAVACKEEKTTVETGTEGSVVSTDSAMTSETVVTDTAAAPVDATATTTDTAATATVGTDATSTTATTVTTTTTDAAPKQ